MPFVGDDDLSGFEEVYDDRRVPPMPAALVERFELDAERYAAGTWVPSTEPECECACCADPALGERDPHGLPHSLIDRFEQQFRAAQSAQAAAWRAAAQMHAVVMAERGALAAEHVGAELALRMGVHPRTGMAVMVTAVRAVNEVPRLAELVQAGCLTDRHVNALLDEAGRWADGDERVRSLIEQTLERCAERAGRYGWPTPGELTRVLKRVALLHDLRAAERRRKSVAERRGVSLTQTGAGAGMLTIEGPDAQLARAYRVIAERAAAMRHLEGDSRSREQREYDAALELLTVDADQPPGGGVSARPTTGLHGEPLELVVRGAHVAVVMPYSIALGGNRELAEIPGFGPLLPSTARELLEHADTLRRVAVDAGTGEVLAVGDAVPGPASKRQRQRPAPVPSSGPEDLDVAGDDPDDDPDDDGGEGRDPDPAPSAPAPPDLSTDTDTDTDTDADTLADPPTDRPTDPASTSRDAARCPVGPADLPADVCPPVSRGTIALLRQLAHRTVIWHDLCTSAYRVPHRLRRFVEHRDRTCCFPGCTVPGRYCDIDHREEWPRGGTHADNCHVLCRRHHRAKQFYFADVTLDPTTGDTCWTTFEGSIYRRPPPRW